MSTYVITDLRPASNFSAPYFATPHSAMPRLLADGAPQGRLRLTRRGRVVVFALLLMAVLTLSVVFGGGSVATGEQRMPSPTEVVVVGQGDTLWAIASEIAAETGERDVRTVMARIVDLNGLESGMLQAGQELRIPLVD